MPLGIEPYEGRKAMTEPGILDRELLATAFDALGQAAIKQGERLEIAVYGGSALMLASNFRFSSEDVDIAVLSGDWPGWLTDAVVAIGAALGLSHDWLNDAVAVHLSAHAGRVADHVAFGTFPRQVAEGAEDPAEPPVGLVVFVPTANYLLAMKLKAMRVLDPVKGAEEAADIRHLMAVVGVSTGQEALAILKRFYPKSAAAPEKLLFLLKHLDVRPETGDAPQYLGRSGPADRNG